MIKRLLIFIIVLNFGSLLAQPVLNIGGQEGRYSLQPYMEILEDKNKAWAISQVASESFNEKFKQSPLNKQVSFGYSKSAFWIRLAIENHSSDKLWWLEVTYLLLNDVRVYIPQKNGDFKIIETGNSRPFQTRPVEHRNLIVPLDLPSEKQFIYLRIQTETSSTFPLILWKPSKFAASQETRTLALGIYLGIVTVMICYNFFLFLSLRDKNYIYYISAVFFILITQISLEGIGFAYLWGEAIYWNKLSIAVLSGFSIAATCYFTRVFLDLKTHFRFGNIAMLVVASLGLLLSFLTFFIGYQPAIKLLSLVGLLNNPIIIIAAIVSYRKGHRSALYFLIAWLGYVTGTMLIFLRGWGILPDNFITANGIQVGSALEVVLFSLALADRINVLKREVQQKALENEKIKRREEEKRNQLILKQKEELEAKVQERTEELVLASQKVQASHDEILTQKEEISLQNEQLQELNTLKDHVFSIIAHDLRSPINSLQALMSLVGGSHELSPEEMKIYIGKLSQKVKGVSELLNNLLFWARSQMQDGLNLSPKNLEVEKVIHEIVQLLAEQSQIKQIKTIVEVEKDILPIYIDPEIIRFLLRNLLSNAYKFSEEKGKVTIKAHKESDNQIKIQIIDEGLGMNESTKNALFRGFVKSQQGTHSEKGTGLGLMLCQEFVALSKGYIAVESEEGKGSIFWFTLPASSADQGLHSESLNPEGFME